MTDRAIRAAADFHSGPQHALKRIQLTGQFRTEGFKETVTEIDTRHPGEGERLQLSNFWVNESQEEKNLEIYLTRLHENADELYTANVYRYTVTFK